MVRQRIVLDLVAGVMRRLHCIECFSFVTRILVLWARNRERIQAQERVMIFSRKLMLVGMMPANAKMAMLGLKKMISVLRITRPEIVQILLLGDWSGLSGSNCRLAFQEEVRRRTIGFLVAALYRSIPSPISHSLSLFSNSSYFQKKTSLISRISLLNHPEAK